MQHGPTVLKVTQVEPNHKFVAWHQLLRCSPHLRHPKRCKDAKKLKDKVRAWALTVAEYDEHQDDGEEEAFGSLNYLAQRNTGGAQWTMKKVAVVVDPGAAENVMPKSMFPEIPAE